MEISLKILFYYLKLNFALSWVFCDYSMLITSYKIGGVHFRLFGMNGFHVKALRMKDLLLRAPVVVRTSHMKISRRRLADYVKTLHQKVCRTCSTITFLHSTNEIIDLWHCRWRCHRQILNSLLFVLHPTFWSLFFTSISQFNESARYCLMWLLLWSSLIGLNHSIVQLY